MTAMSLPRDPNAKAERYLFRYMIWGHIETLCCEAEGWEDFDLTMKEIILSDAEENLAGRCGKSDQLGHALQDVGRFAARYLGKGIDDIHQLAVQQMDRSLNAVERVFDSHLSAKKKRRELAESYSLFQRVRNATLRTPSKRKRARAKRALDLVSSIRDTRCFGEMNHAEASEHESIRSERRTPIDLPA
ncbi:MAG: hypothetical protein KAV00_15140, partial [Phycisphaerae bacterium]|nr:hypothetical protein [Phycisphaerae bacterium]